MSFIIRSILPSSKNLIHSSSQTLARPIPSICSKRYLQTVNQSNLIRTSSSSSSSSSPAASLSSMASLNYSIEQDESAGNASDSSSDASKWSKHSLPEAKSLKDLMEQTSSKARQQQTLSEKRPKKRRRQLKPRKLLITLSPNAVHHLKLLLDQPTPKMIRIGVQNRGCSGLTYHLEYVTEPGKFDEAVEQDGVKVLIDSKLLFSIVGSEMDWIDDKLSSKFVFKNPNSKGTCGCGESFMV